MFDFALILLALHMRLAVFKQKKKEALFRFVPKRSFQAY
jgi:hypothetical protein